MYVHMFKYLDESSLLHILGIFQQNFSHYSPSPMDVHKHTHDKFSPAKLQGKIITVPGFTICVSVTAHPSVDKDGTFHYTKKKYKLPFSHNNSINVWTSYMLPMIWGGYLLFWGERSKSELKFELSIVSEYTLTYHLLTHIGYKDDTSDKFDHDLRGTVMFWGSKSQRLRSKLEFQLCFVSAFWFHHILTYKDTSHMLHMTKRVLIWGPKVKDQGQTWSLKDI